MKRRGISLLSIAAEMSIFLVKNLTNATCVSLAYQPKEPKDIRKFKK